MSGTRIDRRDKDGTQITAMHNIQGKQKVTQRNVAQFMAANGQQNAAMVYAGPHADVEQHNENCVNVMVVGCEGDDLANVAENFKELAGNKIKIKITVDGQQNPYEAKLAPTQTVGEVVLALGDKYKSFFNILRDGKKLDHNMTLAQAAQTGNTVNWIAK